ncbi:MAG: shikimate kinase [bacterium]|nr:shikimate kinase [bacterium]MDZ4248033.1 shikimate kinase [Patescibacteria group bacterium]
MSYSIVLVGMRGSGKSTIAEILGKRLNLRVIDTDARNNYRPSSSSSKAFRDKESAVLKGIGTDIPTVIATGGGTILRKENRRRLRELGTVFCLTAPDSVLYDRIGEDPGRPLLTKASDMREDLRNLAKRRTPLYREVADRTIATKGRRPIEVAEEIARIYRQGKQGSSPRRKLVAKLAAA